MLRRQYIQRPDLDNIGVQKMALRAFDAVICTGSSVPNMRAKLIKHAFRRKLNNRVGLNFAQILEKECRLKTGSFIHNKRNFNL